MEANLVGQTGLYEPVGVDAITVQFCHSTPDQTFHVKPLSELTETSIVEDKVNATTLHRANEVPELVEVVTENVLFRVCEMFTTGRLKLFDVFFGHVDQQGQVGSCTFMPHTQLRTADAGVTTYSYPTSRLESIRGRATCELPPCQFRSPRRHT